MFFPSIDCITLPLLQTTLLSCRISSRARRNYHRSSKNPCHWLLIIYLAKVKPKIGYTTGMTWGLAYTPRNTTDLMQVVDFTSLSPARLSSSCIKSVGFINFNQVCENPTLYSSISTDLLQVIETTCIKLVG